MFKLKLGEFDACSLNLRRENNIAPEASKWFALTGIKVLFCKHTEKSKIIISEKLSEKLIPFENMNLFESFQW